MKRRLIWLACAVTMMAMGMALTACGAPASQDGPGSDAIEAQGGGVEGAGGTEGAEGTEDAGGTPDSGSDAKPEKEIGVYINLSDESILKFDGSAESARLVEDMSSGKAPKSCTVLYDQMGALPSVTVTDSRTIREIYKQLARMHVEGETDMSITDSYHMVAFELQDGTTVAFNFEGEGILVRGRQNFAVTGGDKLWENVRYLQEQYLREQSAGDDWHAITLEDDEELVEKCPTSAPAGETIQVIVPVMADAYVHIAVNGDQGFGEFTDPYTYEFVMPDTPVTVEVWASDDGLGGA